MLRRVNGLFGWVKANERRSLALFAGFVAALNVAAALALYIPLSALDAEHAPVFAWQGYLIRYAPLVTLTGVLLFVAQMLWHVRSVQRTVAFNYVDSHDEPRLCGIAEPLAIQMGLPIPYVGVIETHALNAFACGTGRRNSVVVVTRGLIDSLDDDELAAVIAHELAHIANGDVRLLAAANACLRMIGWLVRPRMQASGKLRELAAFPMIMVAMPPLFLFVIIVGFCAQASLKGAHLVRLLIASSREFIADAAAVESTLNPSALVSALRRIDRASHLPDLAPGCDAMMIAGATEGALATHPTMAQRIEAIIALTGSMALVAPERRDTRPERMRVSVPAVRTARAAPAGLEGGSLRRIGAVDSRNIFGLTPIMSIGAALALVIFAAMHREVLQRPAAALELLDPRPANGLMAVAARGGLCNLAVLSAMVTGAPQPDACSGAAMEAFMAEQAKMGGPVGNLLTSMSEPSKGSYRLPNGGFSNKPPPATEAEQVRANGCYRTNSYRPGDNGKIRPVDAPPDSGGSFNIKGWLASAERLAASAVSENGPTQRDDLLRSYVKTRRTITEAIHHYFGEPGLDLALASFGSKAQSSAVTLLGERLQDPEFAAGLQPVQKAEWTLLVMQPGAFLPCVAQQSRQARAPSE